MSKLLIAKLLGLTFVAGVAAGVATALFAQTQQGRRMKWRAIIAAKRLRRKLMKHVRSTKNLTKERYEAIVDELVERYAYLKALSEVQMQSLKTTLMGWWEEIRRLREEGKTEEEEDEEEEDDEKEENDEDEEEMEEESGETDRKGKRKWLKS